MIVFIINVNVIDCFEYTRILQYGFAEMILLRLEALMLLK